MKILRVFVFVYKYIKPKYGNSKPRKRTRETRGKRVRAHVCVRQREQHLVHLVFSAVFLYGTPN